MDTTQLDKLRSAVFRFDPSLAKKVDDIGDCLKNQKTKAKGKETEENINNVGKVLTSTVNAIEKFQSEDPSKIASGILDIVSSTSVLVGGPYGAVVAAVCSVIGAILSASQPKKPSLVEQLADVVHNELVNFNIKLQDQKFTGLRDRVKRQVCFLTKMKSPDLENLEALLQDYTQFLGEVSERYEKSIPFKYNDDLTKDADVADVVTALVMYCKAYTCFMAFLITAKGRFGDLGDSKSKEMIEQIDIDLHFQKGNAKTKLAFLSDGRYLTFLGRLPSEGGKLTKIVALARNEGARRQVEDVRRSLNLSAMAKLDTVESAAAKVSRQSVELKSGGRSTLPYQEYPPVLKIEIVNETDFPMEIVSGTFSWPKRNLQFEENLKPRSRFDRYILGTFSTAGYFVLHDKLPEDVEKIEFALSNPYVGCRKISVAKVSQFTEGKNTYNNMQDGETKIEYWEKGGVHYMARADIELYERIVSAGTDLYSINYKTWRFVVQDFDPTKDAVEG